jgi:hypothetical protein
LIHLISSTLVDGGNSQGDKPALIQKSTFIHDRQQIYKAENQKLPQVLEFGPERRDKCRRRLAKDPKKFIDQFTRAVIKAQDTPFLCGEGDRGWKADFDWFIANNCNVIQVLEGRYDSTAKPSPGGGPGTVFDKIRKEREERKHGSDRVDRGLGGRL